MSINAKTDALAGRVGTAIKSDRERLTALEAHPERVFFGGQFLLDPNEVCGWSVRGINDDSHTVDLGDVGSNLSRLLGGIHFVQDMELHRFSAWHRNSNAGAQAWGWKLTAQEKVDGANTRTNTNVLDEVADNGGAGPRNYGNTNTQRTDITLATPFLLPAGHVLGVAVAAPTAQTTNRYVQVMSGLMEFRYP